MHKYKFYDDLSIISFNEIQLFYTMTMNFIIDSSTRNFYTRKINDAILILIDKLIKHAIYLIVNKNLNVENLTKFM